MDHLVFEHLLTLNRSVESAIDTLKKLAEYPELQKDGFLVRSSYFREHLSDANLSILEALHGSEEAAGGVAYKERRAYEKTTRDPDDCYLEVMDREQERQEQGLPSLIGIHHGRHREASEGSPPEVSDESGGANSESKKETSGGEHDAQTEPTSDELGERRRQRIIARVEVLRTAKRMTKQEFHEQIGSSAFENWQGFVHSDGGDSWKHVTPQMFEKIARVFGIGSAELLQ
jgi:hypothetical protein